MMNLTSSQRKLVYLVLILILLIPVLFLSQPASKNSPGGKLAQVRKELRLNQSSMGDVDPSSAVMKVVLLGFRGVAADLLWIQAKEQEKKKEWGKYRATANSILLLQPNFEDVWRYTGWDFSFNVSSVWDAVEDRYYWLKEGGKFLREGANQNQYSAPIQWDIGRVLGQKIGIADERTFYRQYFKSDPDPQYEGGTDPIFNPLNIDDNYLAAREDFKIANVRDETFGQQAMKRPIFRIYPIRSLISSASAMQHDGTFDEPRRLWTMAHNELMSDEYGKYEFYEVEGKFHLYFDEETKEADIARLAKENSEKKGREITIKEMNSIIEYYQVNTQFHYWLSRCVAEEDENTMLAHKDIYEGKKLFQESNFDEALKKLMSGMERYKTLLEKFPEYVTGDTEKLDEAMESVLYWSFIYDISPSFGAKPVDYPLKWLWNKNLEHVSGLNQRFRIDNQLN
ncbi:MAG: hypothetical protein R3C11_05910 [Planctomycetaceae bacterium]